MTKWFIYTLAPVDDCWQNLVKLSDYIKESAESVNYTNTWESTLEDNIPHILDEWEEVKKITRGFSCWEGDVRGSVFIYPMFIEESIQRGFMWKQDNNGSTFLVVPQPICHLLDGDIYTPNGKSRKGMNNYVGIARPELNCVEVQKRS